KVSSANGQVVLSGEASDAVSATRAVEVAAGVVSGKDSPVINAMKVAPSQQVMLKVRFLEVDRTAGRDLGVNFFGGNKNGIGVSGLGAISNSANSNASVTGSQTLTSNNAGIASGSSTTTNTATSTIGGALGAGVFPGTASLFPPFGTILANVINTNGLRIDSMISALEDKGLVKSLAEPDLI